jgi:hypothetical protein
LGKTIGRTHRKHKRRGYQELALESHDQVGGHWKLGKDLDLMVATGGIKPPTRGFSVQTQKRGKRLIDALFIRERCEIF